MKVEYSDLENIIKTINKIDDKLKINYLEYPVNFKIWNYAVHIVYDDKIIIADVRSYDLMDDAEKEQKKNDVHNYIFTKLIITGIYDLINDFKKYPPDSTISF